MGLYGGAAQLYVIFTQIPDAVVFMTSRFKMHGFNQFLTTVRLFLILSLAGVTWKIEAMYSSLLTGLESCVSPQGLGWLKTSYPSGA
jgi:uncharacterized membrane protein YqjE